MGQQGNLGILAKYPLFGLGALLIVVAALAVGLWHWPQWLIYPGIGIAVIGAVYHAVTERVEAEKVEAARKAKEAEFRETLLHKVTQSIRKFEPSRRYHNEFGYHTELQGWLKSHFLRARVELKTGASRPDIVIEDVAIEVKGPTDNQALNTLTTKCLKYSHHYNNLILVLFEPTFSESNYDEIIRGLKRHFPNVQVIRKD